MAIFIRKPSKHKYNAKKCEVMGRNFPSQLEGSVYSFLKQLESLGDIENIRQQVEKTVTAEITYTIDFVVFDKRSGEDVFVEAKGIESDKWRYFKKGWKTSGHGKLEVYKGNYRKPVLAEVVLSNRRVKNAP